LQVSNGNFDGDGGTCLTLSTSTDTATGCATGPLMRSGRPLSLHLDGTPYSFFPQGVDGIGQPTLTDEATTCLANVNESGILSDIVSCGEGGVGVAGTLPAEPGGVMAWTLVGAERAPDGLGLEALTSTEPGPGRVYRSPATDQLPACVVIVALDGSAREACAEEGGTLLAGTPDEPLIVSYDMAAGTASATTVDRAATLGVNGCSDLTAGDLLALLPASGTAGSLLCGGDAGVAWQPGVLLHTGGPDGAINILARAPDGTWSVADSGTGITCDDGVNNEACAEIGITHPSQTAPIPTSATLGAFGDAVGAGSPVTGRPAEELAAVQSAGDLQALADAIVAELEAQGAEPGQVTVTVANESLLVVRRSNMDDSLTHTVFAVHAPTMADGGVVVTAARAADICGRGTTTVDGETLCV
jgi:hypothetical protein